MAEDIQVVGETIVITKAVDPVTSTLSVREVQKKIAEIQTKIDHLTLDINALEVEKSEWAGYLVQMEGI